MAPNCADPWLFVPVEHRRYLSLCVLKPVPWPSFTHPWELTWLEPSAFWVLPVLERLIPSLWEVSKLSHPHSDLVKDTSTDTSETAKVVTCQPSNWMEPTVRKDNADVPDWSSKCWQVHLPKKRNWQVEPDEWLASTIIDFWAQGYFPFIFALAARGTAFQQLSHNLHQAAEHQLAACLKWIQTTLSEQRTQHICKQEGLGFVACGEEEIRVTFLLPAAPSVLENFLLAHRSPRRKRCLCNFGFHHWLWFRSGLYTEQETILLWRKKV